MTEPTFELPKTGIHYNPHYRGFISGKWNSVIVCKSCGSRGLYEDLGSAAHPCRDCGEKDWFETAGKWTPPKYKLTALFFFWSSKTLLKVGQWEVKEPPK